jgi:hypothetical protein
MKHTANCPGKWSIQDDWPVKWYVVPCRGECEFMEHGEAAMKDFNRSMQNLQATTGATKGEMDKLRASVEKDNKS